MKHLPEMVFERKTLFYFLLFAMAAGGVLSFLKIGKLEDPEIAVMMARVVTVYPGATAHEVELQVTAVLEEELSTLADVRNITSKSEQNVSLITVELEMTVPQEEYPQRWDHLRRKVNAAALRLPAGARAPGVIDDYGDVFGMFYAMTAGGYSWEETDRYARFAKQELLGVEGVKRVEIYGSQPPCADVVISTETMGQLGVYPFQVMSAIAGENQTVYPGVLETGGQLVPVGVSDKIGSVDALKNIVITGVHGDQFRLGDIAKVEKGYNTPLRNTLYLNNERALAVSVSMEKGENIVQVGRRVEKKMEEIRSRLPAGVAFRKVFFQPDVVSGAISGFMWNLVASVAIVILVLMVTMGFRSGVIIGVGLILTVLATFPLLLASGGSLHRISLGAFIVAMGMLVDNAIVVQDGILAGLAVGADRATAFTRPARRTAMPLLGATLITVVAFMPVYLSKDTAGTYARDLFIVLSISLLISWLLSLTQVPLFSAGWLKEKRRAAGSPSSESRMHRAVRKTLAFLINHKAATIGAATLLMLLAAYNIRNIRNAFFPDMNYRQIYVEYQLPDGTSPDRVNSDLRAITSYLQTLGEVKMVVSSQGMTPARYCLVRAMGEGGDAYGELIVDLEDYPAVVRMKPILADYLHENFPDARIRIRKYNLSILSSHTVEVEIRGADPAVLRNLGRQVQEIMRRSPYADPYSICDNWNPVGRSLVAHYDQILASRAGVSRSDLGNALLAATSGLPLATFWEGETPYVIRMKTRRSDGGAVEDLKDIPVWSMLPDVGRILETDPLELFTGTRSVEEISRELISPVPLSAVTSGVRLGWEETLVRRSNGQRSLEAQCDPAEGFSPEQLRASIRKEVESLPLPEGYTFRWLGEHDLQKNALRTIFGFLPLSMVLIILILLLLFGDLKRPLIILSVIPLTALGIVPGLLLTRSPFTFMAIVGAFGLIGMLVKNSVVLVDEIVRRINGGIPRYTALVNATMSRIRPVTMASLTTILGMLPLLFDPMYRSMAVTIISGLLAGTLITLVFVPILYAYFFRIRKEEAGEEEIPARSGSGNHEN